MSNVSTRTNTLAKLGILAAVSVVLVAIVHFPLIPAAAFLEYDPADIPILLGTFALGPVAGLLLTVVASIIQGVTVSAASGWYGILMHVIATGTYVLVAGNIYKANKTKKQAILALVCGTLAMAAVMIPANLFITPIFMGAPRAAVAASISASTSASTSADWINQTFFILNTSLKEWNLSGGVPPNPGPVRRLSHIITRPSPRGKAGFSIRGGWGGIRE